MIYIYLFFAVRKKWIAFVDKYDRSAALRLSAASLSNQRLSTVSDELPVFHTRRSSRSSMLQGEEDDSNVVDYNSLR